MDKCSRIPPFEHESYFILGGGTVFSFSCWEIWCGCESPNGPRLAHDLAERLKLRALTQSSENHEKAKNTRRFFGVFLIWQRATQSQQCFQYILADRDQGSPFTAPQSLFERPIPQRRRQRERKSVRERDGFDRIFGIFVKVKRRKPIETTP